MLNVLTLKTWAASAHPLSPLLIEASHLDPEGFTKYFGELAALLLCLTRNACGHCSGCKKLNKGYHPDWISLVEAPALEDLRKALQQLRYQPFEARFRILSIADFGRCNRFVQNACLKTLEEPSSHWIILLGTQSKENVLDTVRSRSLLWRLAAPSPEALDTSTENLFQWITSKDEIKIFSWLETRLKDRDQARELFSTLLTAASDRHYPGHWKFLAPWLEESLILLSRNLSAKTLWDRSWALSLPTSDI